MDIKSDLEVINKRINTELLRKTTSSKDGHLNVDLHVIDELEADLARINKMPMSMDEKVQVKKMQLRVQSYKRNQAVMKVGIESEQIGAESLQQLRAQTDQLQYIDRTVDDVGASVVKSHQIIREMRKRKRRIYIIGAAIGLFVVGMIVVAVILVL